MKTHLPLTLRRALLGGLTRRLYRTLCTGSLFLAGSAMGMESAPVAESSAALPALTLRAEVLHGAEDAAASAYEAEEEADGDETEVTESALTTGKGVSEELFLYTFRPEGALLENLLKDEIGLISKAVYALADLISDGTSESGPIKAETARNKERAGISFSLGAPRRIVIWELDTPFIIHNYDAAAYARRKQQAAEAAEKKLTTIAVAGLDEEETSTPLAEGDEITYEESEPISTPVVMPGMMRMMRSVMAVAAIAEDELETLSSDISDTVPDGYISWTGSTSANWNTTTANWVENNVATAYAAGDSVFFGSGGQNKAVNVTTAQAPGNMVVAAGGYSFTGGGNISVSGALDIYADGDTTFNSANAVSATTVNLNSEVNTQTNFAGTLTATTLNIGNGKRDPLHAGSYTFGDAVSVSGAVGIDIGTADTNANNTNLLTANGSFTAGSLTLSGAAMKTFNAAVETTGNLTVYGSTSALHDGLAIFNAATKVGGHLILDQGGSARFGNNSNLSLTGDVYLGNATLSFERFTNDATYAFGDIFITADGARLIMGSLTRASATITSKTLAGDTSTAFDLTMGGARAFAVNLSNLNNLTVEGGVATISSTSGGAVAGDLTLTNAAALTVACDELFTTAAPGNISVSGGSSVDFGSTSQSFNGDITLSGGIIKGNALTATSATTLTYTGTGNMLSGALSMGSNDLTVVAAPAADAASAADTTLSLDGSISGTGTLTFEGSGTTTISGTLGFTGEVHVGSQEDVQGSGTTLVLASTTALKDALKVTVDDGATLSIIHSGASVEMNGAGVLSGETEILDVNNPTQYVQQMIGLELEDGAVLTFTNLNGHEDTAAIALQGGLLFHGGVTFNFIQEDGSNLKNLHTYELITSKTGINAAADSLGGVTVIANGKTTPLDSSQYEFGFYKDENDLRHFTITMLVGKAWCGGASGEWHEMDETGTDYANWTEGAVGDTALFRTQEGIEDVSITIGKQSGTTSLYMDGTTNYTISAAEGLTGNMFANDGVYLVKKGSATMAFNALKLNMGDIDLNEGTLKLTGNSTLSSTGTISVADAATLSIESGSDLTQGSASLSAYSSSVAATVQGVTLADAVISGSGSTNAVITAAALDGFTMDNVTLSGTGSMANMTINSDVTIASGATYYLGTNMAMLSTVTNEGTVVVDKESTLIGVGRLGSYVESDEGYTITYTPFTGGSYVGWDTLDVGNFRIRGTNLDDIYDVTVDVSVAGQVTVSSDYVKFLRWDTEFNPDTWDTPTVSLAYSGSRSDVNIVALSGTNLRTTYRYDQRVDGGRTDTHVININTGAGSNGNALYGIATGAEALTSEDAPVHLWINDEGSNFSTYVAGATTGTYYGDTHLQVAGALTNATTIIGASQGAVQYGDSYLTIETGTYTGASVIAGSSGAVHYGNSSLHLVDGTYGTVYGGTYNSYTSGGDTRVVVDGGTITTIYGGDYSTTSNTHTGNVTIDLRGGTVTNVYAAGDSDGTNVNSVSGDATVNLYADSDGTMLTSFATGAQLWGGENYVSGTSTLTFANAGTYNLTAVTIDTFDRLEMAAGANVSVTANVFNGSNALTISGPGTVTLNGASTDERKTGDLYLENGATVALRVYSYTNHNSNPTAYPSIHVESGSTVDVTGYPVGNDIAVHLYLAGDGTDGQGALWKGNVENGSADNKVQLGYITLTDHASVGNGGSAAGSSAIYMIPLMNTSYASLLDLTNGGTNARGYIFTKQGSDIFGFYNTDVTGGTINVVGGTLFTNCSSYAADTDLILHSGTTLDFGSALGNVPGTGETTGVTAVAATLNGFTIESLSGEGTVDLGTVGELAIAMDQGYTGFHEDFGTKAQAGQLFYNDKGYTYAVYSGAIEGTGNVSKSGSGTQEFAGSASTYEGSTLAEGGILYLTGTSTATDFAQAGVNSSGDFAAATKVTEGVVGEGYLQWQGGAVYLGDGVRIYNASAKANNSADSVIGVYGGAELDGNTYHEATYSGVIETACALRKVGLGTLNFDQLGRFGEGAVIEGGTLNLYGWADADNYGITQNTGTTLMFSYDGTYGEEETSEITSTLYATGTGDVRWLAEARTDMHTAAIISNIGAGAGLTISGTIVDGTSAESGISLLAEDDELAVQADTTISGNLLHSGEGTLTLSGANTYSGGTTVTAGTVIVANNTGLGATASGGSANLVTYAGSRVEFADGVTTTLAAVKEGTYAGNDIRGTIAIGTGATDAATARLNMTGNGYYAERTELESNGYLVFSGADASNWDGLFNTAGNAPASTEDMAGAGILAGSGTVVVTNAAAHYTQDAADADYVEGTTVYFQVTDALHTGDAGYTGDIVVEGDNSMLYIHGGQLSGGNYDVSGNNARLDAKRSAITVGSGQHVSLSSLGDANAAGDSTAVLAASSMEVVAGGTLSVARAATDFQYLKSEDITAATQLSLQGALTRYSGPYPSEGSYHVNTDYYSGDNASDATGYSYYFNSLISANAQTVGTLNTVEGLILNSGSIYSMESKDTTISNSASNISLTGTPLTLNVTNGVKIILNGGERFQAYLQSLADAGKNEEVLTRQWVLFSDVAALNVALNTTDEFGAVTETISLIEDAYAITSGVNQIYVAQANDVFTTDSSMSVDIADNILLVYDAGAQVVFFDRLPNNTAAAPEPTTTTLSLLALTALAARRRRR